MPLRPVHITVFSACICSRWLHFSREIENILSLHWHSPLRKTQTTVSSVNQLLTSETAIWRELLQLVQTNPYRKEWTLKSDIFDFSSFLFHTIFTFKVRIKMRFSDPIIKWVFFNWRSRWRQRSVIRNKLKLIKTTIFAVSE